MMVCGQEGRQSRDQFGMNIGSKIITKAFEPSQIADYDLRCGM
jgi:hypothetical protein